MKCELQNKVLSLQKEHRRKRKKTWIIGGLSLAVAITTALCLRLPAITMETVCGYENHSHGPACYTVLDRAGERSIICETEDREAIVLHTHDAYCCDADGSLLCTLREITAHRHEADCYKEERTLSCGLEETEGHVHLEQCYEDAREAVCEETECPDGHLHTEDCFEDPRTPVCGEEENEEHRHTEDCFENPRRVLCGFEEGDDAHTHGRGCYREKRVLVCEKDEIIPHAHTEDCADGSCGLTETVAHQHTGDCIRETEGSTERVLTCTRSEHEHTPECFPDQGTFCGIKAHSHDETCFEGSGRLICGRQEHEHNDACLESGAERKEDRELTLSCKTESGLLVTVSGPAGSFPAAADDLTLSAREIRMESAEEEELAAFDQLDAFLSASQDMDEVSVRLFDITLCSEGQEVQLTGPVAVSFCGIEETGVHAYHVSPASVESLKVSTPEEGTAVFETEHFSWFAIVTEETQDAQPVLALRNSSSETASLTVRKAWIGGTSRPAVTVALYDGDGPTGHTLTLSADNNWTGEFTGLAVPEEGHDLGYYVVEQEVSDYLTTYGAISPVSTVTDEAYWVPVANNQMTDGGSYVFCTQYTDGNYYTPASHLGDNTSYMSALQVSKGAGPITINGTSYNDYLIGVDDAAIFIASAPPSGLSGLILQNAYTGKCFSSHGNCYKLPEQLTSTSTYLLSFTDGKIWSRNGGGRYVKQTATQGVGNHDFSTTTNAAQASTFQLYEAVAVTATEHAYETTITNTYIDPGGGGGSGGDYSPYIHKTIDYLGDGGSNPDTTLSGDEYYRLYLDVTAAAASPTPVDLLLVLDNSGSMFVPDNSLGGLCRNDALLQTLRSLIPQFLKANPDNRISIVYFSGKSGYFNGYPFQLPNDDPTGPADGDAWTACGWTTNTNDALGSLLTTDYHATDTGSGTNYMQGLLEAEKQLNTVASGHTPYVLFMSDGVPTYYVKHNGYRGGNGFDTIGRSIQSGWYAKAQQNIARCYDPTCAAIDGFQATHSNVTMSAVAFSSEMQGDRLTVIQRMPNAGGFFQRAVNTEELYSAFAEAFQAATTSGVHITDQLSPYVELYGAQADYKVTMTPVSGGSSMVLYENDAVTTAGNGIIDSVIYTPNTASDSTGTVRLNFVDSYELDSNYRYTISFNVQVTERAYTEFSSSGYGEITGDECTDYPGNTTSSEQLGFHSNKVAYVDYTVGGTDYTAFYPHPVVQVNARTVGLTVQKQVIGGSLTEEFPFEIVFTDSSGQRITDIPAGNGYTVGSDGKVIFTLTDGQSVTISGLPTGTTATITETGHDGYTVLIKEGIQSLFTSDTGSITLNDDRTITVVNNAGTVLPETGGAGTLPFTLSGTATMLATLMYCCGWRKRERRSRL